MSFYSDSQLKNVMSLSSYTIRNYTHAHRYYIFIKLGWFFPLSHWNESFMMSGTIQVSSTYSVDEHITSD